jgi:hypothetical protein
VVYSAQLAAAIIMGSATEKETAMVANVNAASSELVQWKIALKDIILPVFYKGFADEENLAAVVTIREWGYRGL